MPTEWGLATLFSLLSSLVYLSLSCPFSLLSCLLSLVSSLFSLFSLFSLSLSSLSFLHEGIGGGNHGGTAGKPRGNFRALREIGAHEENSRGNRGELSRPAENPDTGTRCLTRTPTLVVGE